MRSAKALVDRIIERDPRLKMAKSAQKGKQASSAISDALAKFRSHLKDEK